MSTQPNTRQCSSQPLAAGDVGQVVGLRVPGEFVIVARSSCTSRQRGCRIPLSDVAVWQAENANVMIATNPECLAGLCGQASSSPTARLPSQGPAPLSVWGFSLADPGWTTATGSMRKPGYGALMGFSVMRSPNRGLVKGGRRIASQASLNRPDRVSDAVAPEGKEAEQPARVSFAHPAPQST
jgi:hypothetical protein